MKNRSPLILAIILLATAGLITLSAIGIGDENAFSVGSIRQGLDLQGGVSILYEANITNPSTSDMNAANELLRNRLDARGYTEATVMQEGTRQIRVDIPGVDDPQAAVREIGASAVLEFFDQFGNPFIDAAGNQLTGAHVSNARAMTQQGHGGGIEMVVALDFDAIGRQLFADATTANVGRPIVIVMDGEVISEPIVNTPIRDGNAIISGGGMGFSISEAESLARLINQGSLPFALSVISDSLVGARLGADALRTSIIAGIIGLALVLIIMAAVYKTMGLAADLALIIYVVLVLIIVSAMGVTLSLPGIAGLILSIGMATDANVVIFERIREEILSGKSLRSAMRTGYRRAWPAIIDSNVTTLIAGVVLFRLGTGPIMGFAQILIIGILLSMFTSLLVTRIITSCFMDIGIVKTKHILNKTQQEALAAASGEVHVEVKPIPFVQKRRSYFIFSGAVIAVAVVFSLFHWQAGNGFFNLDVQFSGGTAITVTFDQPFDTSTVEDIVRNVTGESAPMVQSLGATIAGGADAEHQALIRTTIDEANPGMRDELFYALMATFNLTMDDIEYTDVSPAVSAAMRRSAMLAVLVSSLAMLVYIAIRFRDIRTGASAVLAQVHDAVVVFGLYAILRIPLNDAFIAVMLTTLGYSINATIIIFDRIRENKGRMPKASYEELINTSATQTLRRTILSTATTFAAVFMLYAIGVASVRDFTLPIMVGLLFGAYSSICLSGSTWYMMVKNKIAKKAA
ncbi:MAG: protein translocase subunit SecD [Defluviitaleaceae bacterium]|nr:protein translocase subunit SecD [Defluviitaleaceae bacterium]